MFKFEYFGLQEKKERKTHHSNNGPLTYQIPKMHTYETKSHAEDSEMKTTSKQHIIK